MSALKRIFQSDSARIGLSCAVLAGLTLLIYWDCLTKFFAMEDFFCLSWVQREGLEGVLKSYYTDNVYGVYRPTSVHVFYYLCRFLFGLDPLGYHLVNLVSHTLNVLLVFALSMTLVRDCWTSFIAGAVYTSRISHYIGVFWVAGINEIWVTLFYLISMTTFVVFMKRNKPSYRLASLLSFAIALTCKENAVTLPLVILSLGFLYDTDFHPKRAAKMVGPYLVVLLLYLVMKFIIFKPMAGALYEVGVGIWIYRNLLLYILWQVNPSHLALIFLKSFTDMRPYEFLNDVRMLWYALAFTAITCLGLTYFLRRRITSGLTFLSNNCSGRLLLAGLTTFVVGISPALLLANRIQEYYLFIPSIGFSLCVAAVLGKHMRKTLAGVLIAITVCSTVVGFALLNRIPDGRTTVSAKSFLEDLNEIINSKDGVSHVYIHNSNTFIYQVLWNGEAFNTFLDNPVPIVFDIHQVRPPSGEGVLEVNYDGEHLRQITESAPSESDQ